MYLLLVKPTTVNFLRLFVVCGRTRNFLRLLVDRILNFLRIKRNLTSFCCLRVLVAQELLVPLLVCALFLGCTVARCHYLMAMEDTVISSYSEILVPAKIVGEPHGEPWGTLRP